MRRLWRGVQRRGILPLIATLAVMFALDGTAYAAAKTRVLKPEPGAPSIKVHIGKKTKRYYATTRVKPVEYRIGGPIAIRVMSRCTYPSPSLARTTRYNLLVEVDGVPLRTISERAPVSRSARGLAGTPIGALQSGVIRIPAGQHRVRIAPNEATTILVRVLTGTGRRPIGHMVPYQPETFVRAMRVHENDQESTVYRFTSAQPIRLALRGPVPVRLVTRLDFGMDTGVTQNYVIRVMLDEKPFKTFPLKATASHTASYPDMPEIAPGKARSVALVIPRGIHQIVVLLDGTTADGATARIEIPQPTMRGTPQ
jgi:hypothetical protein